METKRLVIRKFTASDGEDFCSVVLSSDVIACTENRKVPYIIKYRKEVNHEKYK